jgi:hypothetical protein
LPPSGFVSVLSRDVDRDVDGDDNVDSVTFDTLATVCSAGLTAHPTGLVLVGVSTGGDVVDVSSAIGSFLIMSSVHGGVAFDGDFDVFSGHSSTGVSSVTDE